MSFHDQVRKAQSKLGYTRQELSQALGISPHTLDSWLKPEEVASARPVPEWAIMYLDVLVTGRPRTVIDGAIAITYQRAEDL